MLGAIINILKLRFTRITTSSKYIAQLDGLRTMAFSAVFLIHLNHQVSAQYFKSQGSEGGTSLWHRVLEAGEFGVPLFFAISGFILGLPFAKAALGMAKSVSLKRFYLRRLTRLEPPLIINVTILYLVVVMVRNGTLGQLFPNFLATLSYLHNVVFGESSLINSVTWSLEVEVQFYILAPFLTLLFRIPSRVLRTIIFCAIALICIQFDRHFPKFTLLAQLEYFMMGFIAIDLYLALGERKEERFYRWDLAGCLACLGIIVVALWQRRIPEIRFLLPFLIFVALYAPFRGNFLKTVMGSKLAASIGCMTYTCYLYHMVIIAAAVRVLGALINIPNYYAFFAINLIVVYPACILVCAFLFLAFERPFMRSDWPQRLAAAIRRRREGTQVSD